MTVVVRVCPAGARASQLARRGKNALLQVVERMIAFCSLAGAGVAGCGSCGPHPNENHISGKARSQPVSEEGDRFVSGVRSDEPGGVAPNAGWPGRPGREPAGLWR